MSEVEIAARVLAGAERAPIGFADPRSSPRTYDAYRTTSRPLLALAERFAESPGLGTLEVRTPEGRELRMSR
jgi:hypothetical protein